MNSNNIVEEKNRNMNQRISQQQQRYSIDSKFIFSSKGNVENAYHHRCWRRRRRRIHTIDRTFSSFYYLLALSA